MSERDYSKCAGNTGDDCLGEADPNLSPQWNLMGGPIPMPWETKVRFCRVCFDRYMKMAR